MKKILIALLATATLITVGAKVNADNKRQAEWENTRSTITVTVPCGSGIGLDFYGYQYKPEWMDVREYRYEIMQLNGMTSASLQSGQKLKLYVCTEQYTVQGWCWYDTITTVDGNVWGYDNDTNGCAYVTFNDNGTADNIYDDIIVSVEHIK